ncbi:hypothetical protein BDW66DRAFT_22147 [Aspergillus desertorum]
MRRFRLVFDMLLTDRSCNIPQILLGQRFCRKSDVKTLLRSSKQKSLGVVAAAAMGAQQQSAERLCLCRDSHSAWKAPRAVNARHFFCFFIDISMWI